MSELIKTIYEYPWTTFWMFIGLLVIIAIIKDVIVEIIKSKK